MLFRSAWCSIAQKQPHYTNVAGQRVPGLPAYVCNIAHPEPQSLFLLSDKQARAPQQWTRQRRLTISAIEPVRQAPCQCIAVSHPQRLYITNDDVVTHNTAFAVNIAEHVALNEGLPVAIFSMEMGAAQLAVRVVGSIGRIDQGHLRTGKLTDDEWPRLTEAIEKLRTVSLHIDETPGLTPSELRANARRLARQCGKLGLIVVDYLQLMSGSAGSQGENRATELGEISRGLKMLAKELQCPVIALSQLNRSVEQRTDKRPMMSDLRECVTGDTLVWLADGRRVPIAELVGQQPWVHAVGSNQKLVQAQSDLVWQVGEKPVWRLHLASGRSIRATAKHRFMTGSGWQELQNIHIGNRLALARQTGERAADAQSDLFWDTVVSVEEAGTEPVYDLTVPGPACWIANDGIVTHNSGAIEQDADIIMFIYRDDYYNKDSKEPNVAEVIIGKQRNGPTGTVKLFFQKSQTRFESLAMGSSDDF